MADSSPVKLYSLRMLRLTLAVLHLLALGLGLGSVIFRGVALIEPLTTGSLRRAFFADNLWGVAALLWIGTGLWRLLGATEKSTGYYLHNHVFFAKMGLLGLLFLLEIWPMVTLIRWRIALGRGLALDVFASSKKARYITAISFIEVGLVVAIVVAAVSMARGYGTGLAGFVRPVQ